MILFPLELQHCEAQVFVDVLDPHSYRKFEGQSDREFLLQDGNIPPMRLSYTTRGFLSLTIVDFPQPWQITV